MGTWQPRSRNHWSNGSCNFNYLPRKFVVYLRRRQITNMLWSKSVEIKIGLVVWAIVVALTFVYCVAKFGVQMLFGRFGL